MISTRGFVRSQSRRIAGSRVESNGIAWRYELYCSNAHGELDNREWNCGQNEANRPKRIVLSVRECVDLFFTKFAVVLAPLPLIFFSSSDFLLEIPILGISSVDDDARYCDKWVLKIKIIRVLLASKSSSTILIIIIQRLLRYVNELFRKIVNLERFDSSWN